MAAVGNTVTYLNNFASVVAKLVGSYLQILETLVQLSDLFTDFRDFDH